MRKDTNVCEEHRSHPGKQRERLREVGTPGTFINVAKVRWIGRMWTASIEKQQMPKKNTKQKKKQRGKEGNHHYSRSRTGANSTVNKGKKET